MANNPQSDFLRLPCLSIPPTAATHTHTVIFLHGRGSSAPRFSAEMHSVRNSGGRTLVQCLPTLRWVFPEAPLQRRRPFPIRGRGGLYGDREPPELWHQWFDDPYDSNPVSGREWQPPGIWDMIPSVLTVIDDEAERLGGRWDRVLLAGFGTGASMAAYTLFNVFPPLPGEVRDHPGLCAFMGFSGRIPFPRLPLQDVRWESGYGENIHNREVLNSTPVMLQHAVSDNENNIRYGIQFRDIMIRYGANVTWKEYSYRAHGFTGADGVDDMLRFLGAVTGQPILTFDY